MRCSHGPSRGCNGADGSALRQQVDGIDGRAVRFLLKRNLVLKKKEEARREMEEEEYERRIAGTQLLSSSRRRALGLGGARSMASQGDPSTRQERRMRGRRRRKGFLGSLTSSSGILVLPE